MRLRKHDKAHDDRNDVTRHKAIDIAIGNTTGENSQPLAMPIPSAGRMIGVRRSTVYKLLDCGNLESIKIGKRRLVLVASIHRFIAAKAAEAKREVA